LQSAVCAFAEKTAKRLTAILVLVAYLLALRVQIYKL